MCFRKDRRLLTSRAYLGLSTNKYIFFKANKNIPEVLVFELVNKSGTISFEISDKDNKLIRPKEVASTGTYEYPLEKGMRYKIHITSKATSGSYKIYLKR